MKAWLRFLLVQICLLGTGTAAPGFQRQWERELDGRPAPGSRGITGPWEGTWKSEKNGHTGELRCLVEAKDGGKYVFRYWAKWCGGLSGTFSLPCQVARAGGGYAVSGSKNLGLFGTYHHEGTITGDRFEARFRSNRKNLGALNLRRPEGWTP